MTSWDSKYDEGTYYNKKLPFATQSDEIYETSVKKGEKGDIDDLHGAFADKFTYRKAIVKDGNQWYRLTLSTMDTETENMAYNIGAIDDLPRNTL